MATIFDDYHICVTQNFNLWIIRECDLLISIKYLMVWDPSGSMETILRYIGPLGAKVYSGALQKNFLDITDI